MKLFSDNKDFNNDLKLIAVFLTLLYFINWQAYFCFALGLFFSEVGYFFYEIIRDYLRLMASHYTAMIELEDYQTVELDELIEVQDQDIIEVLEIIPEED